MFRMTVEDVFVIRGRGLVATGKVESGSINKGDEIRINGDRAVAVDGIEAFRKVLDTANEGMNVGLLFAKLDRDDVKAGDVLTDGDGVQSSPSGDDLGEAARHMGLGG